MSSVADEPLDGELIDAHSSFAELARVDIDVQIATAHAYPRSIKEFKQKAMELATLDEDTAGSMFYVLPRAGKKIEGPSVRLAEVVGSCYKNLRYQSRVVKVDAEFVTAQGVCHDLENNNAASIEVKRRITDKNGRRYNADMIQTTGNAACSIALREAIFRVVPRALFKDVYDSAKLTSIGKAESMATRRHKMVDWFKKAGATEAEVLGFLDIAGIDDMGVDDLIQLRGLATAIRDGDTTIEDALRPREEATDGRKVGKSDLESKLTKPAAQRKPDEATQELPPDEPDASDPVAKMKAEIAATFENASPKDRDAAYDYYCGPESPLPNEDMRQFAKQCFEATKERGKGKQKQLV